MNKTRSGCRWLVLSLLLISCLGIQAAGPTGAVVKITSIEEFDRYLQSGNHIVAYFSSATCGPCKAFHDTYYGMAKEYPDVVFLEICHGTFPGSETLLNKYAIQSFPTFVFFDKSGAKKNSFSGANERTKAKIVGEIIMLKEGKCGATPVTYATPPQQAPQPAQSKPMPTKPVQRPVQSKSVQQATPQQQMPKKVQNVQQAMPNNYAPMQTVPQNSGMMQQSMNGYQSQGAAVRGQGAAQQQTMSNAQNTKPVRNPRIRRLGRRMRQRDINAEYQ